MMTTLTKTVADYLALFEKGDNLLLIDLFYADDMQQVENDEPPTIGKAVIKAKEEKNLHSVTSFEQKIVSLVIDEAKSMVMGEMLVFFDSKKYGPKKLFEAFIQHWKDGKIVYQKFYYKSFIDNNG
jgi:ketosteroid isomerase-like protein